MFWWVLNLFHIVFIEFFLSLTFGNFNDVIQKFLSQIIRDENSRMVGKIGWILLFMTICIVSKKNHKFNLMIFKLMSLNVCPLRS